jgi:hypothetical protein
MIAAKLPDVSPRFNNLYSITSKEHSTKRRNFTSTESLIISFQEFKLS